MAKVAVLVDALYHDLEVWYPYLRLKEEGHVAIAAGCGDTSYVGKYGVAIAVDAQVRDLDPAELAGVVIPGGWAPDRIRLHQPRSTAKPTVPGFPLRLHHRPEPAARKHLTAKVHSRRWEMYKHR